MLNMHKYWSIANGMHPQSQIDHFIRLASQIASTRPEDDDLSTAVVSLRERYRVFKAESSATASHGEKRTMVSSFHYAR